MNAKMNQSYRMVTNCIETETKFILRTHLHFITTLKVYEIRINHWVITLVEPFILLSLRNLEVKDAQEMTNFDKY